MYTTACRQCVYVYSTVLNGCAMHKGNNVVATAVRFMPHSNKCLNRAFYARTTHEMQLWVEMIIRVFCIFPGIRHGLKFKTTVQLTHIHHSPNFVKCTFEQREF